MREPTRQLQLPLKPVYHRRAITVKVCEVRRAMQFQRAIEGTVGARGETCPEAHAP